MDLTLLGTGTAEGWPAPRCACSSCTSSRAAGSSRAATSALLDGRLLVDPGAGVVEAVQQAGVDLTRLRHILLTHLDDVCGPAGLVRLLAGSSGPAAPVDVVAPQPVLDRVRDSLGPGVRLVPAGAGDLLRVGDHDVRVWPAGGTGPEGGQVAPTGDPVVYDVTGPGGRLLLAPCTGALPEATVQALRGAAVDVVLLDETLGDRDAATRDGSDEPGAATGSHLGLRSFPEQLRRLRAVGALGAECDVIAVHLSHRNPSTTDLTRRLADWGARTVADGETLDERPARIPAGRTLVLGGARSGKSREAERLVAAERNVTYVATAYPPRQGGAEVEGQASPDDEWAQRVRVHRERRPGHWSTVETLDLVALLEAPGGPLLIDCLTLWLTRVVDRHDGWDDRVWARSGHAAVAGEVDALVDAWRDTRRRVVAVSNEVGQGVVPDSASGRRFRDLMGAVNARIAAETEDVRWCVAGRVQPL